MAHTRVLPGVKGGRVNISKKPNLDAVDAGWHGRVLECWNNKEDIESILCLLNDGAKMCFVVDNIHQLKDRGVFEKALLSAYVSIRTNFSQWKPSMIGALFLGFADQEKLREAGDPIPNLENLTLYRGVSGSGRARRVQGLSWTDSVEVAAWFAMRFYHLPDPAVFKVTVPNEHILARCEERNESEYFLRLPLPQKPKRVKFSPDELKLMQEAVTSRNRENQKKSIKDTRGE